MATPATTKAAGKKAATAAGAGSSGTTNTSASGSSSVTGAPAPVAATEAKQAEAGTIAEALTPPGGSVGEVISGTVEARPDGAEPGEKVDGLLKALLVRALPEAGFRRAGRHWPAEAVEVPADELTAEQIDALLREPMLHVTLIGEPDGE